MTERAQGMMNSRSAFISRHNIFIRHCEERFVRRSNLGPMRLPRRPYGTLLAGRNDK